MLRISDRAFKQMRALGAVDAAHGTGRSARYAELHLAQARRVLELMDSHGLSMPAAAELLRASGYPILSQAGKKSNRRRAIDACISGKIQDLGAGVFLVSDPRSHSKLQRQLLIELRRCVALNYRTQEQRKQRGSAAFRSLVHRAR